MAYSEQLADRVRDLLGGRSGVTERKMFGGVAWMVGGNMGCGVLGDELIVRLAPADAERALAEPGVRPMDATGRPMRGFAMVDPGRLESERDLAEWVDAGASYAASLPAKG